MEKLRLKILHESEGWVVLRVISQPNPWPEDFNNGEIGIRSHAFPYFFEKHCLYVRGSNREKDNMPFAVPSESLDDIREAVRAFNAKHAPDGGEPADIIE